MRVLNKILANELFVNRCSTGVINSPLRATVYLGLNKAITRKLNQLINIIKKYEIGKS